MSDALLRSLVGPKVYARGVAYHDERRVEILSIDDRRVLARVRGSEAYRVELHSAKGRPGGACDCPAFEDAGFCKHLVAVALSVTEALDAGTPPADRLSAARRYLQAQGVDALVDRLLRQALRDEALLAEIELDAADAEEDEAALAGRYRAMIDEACDGGGYVNWRGARDYAEGIGEVLERLQGLIDSGRAALVVTLLDHLFDEMEEAYEDVDDSEGEVSGVLSRAVDIHLEACRKAPADPLALAAALLERELNCDWAAFEGAVAIYFEVLGPRGVAEYRRLATAAWDAAGAERPWGLRAILDGFAKEEGDLDARIALRKGDLKTPRGYVEIAALLSEGGRADEALRWLEEGLWCFEDKPDERLHSFAAELMAKANRSAEAETLLWDAFTRWPSLHLYKELQRACPEAGPRIERALGILRQPKAGSDRVEFFRSPPIVLLEIRIEEGLFDAAWETADAYDIGDMRLEALAEASAASHPERATAAYEKLIESRVRTGGAPSYDAAIRLIQRRAITGRESQAAYLADLAVRHKARRTFIPRLEALR
ncbi:DUF6880 family protein [Caulobacter sp. NIBR1757]|uniref:SWIM zinc finger family protein n=1 Tax=Caulobacter sp. NIBR1757 TaxID=3016000 RepID=UPI0022F11577|nr:DUF6880 family protein [Caulobacter sp. NIBR1757]